MLQTPRQDDFQFRLAQWLLDQLKCRKELESLTQQFRLLVTQTQEQSIGDLYVHIGSLILERITRVQQEDSMNDIGLYAEFCYHLLAIHFEQLSALPLRVAFIHEHLFCLCIASITAEDIVGSAKAEDKDERATGSGTMASSNTDRISIEKSSKLLFHLFKFQLISLAQISEYIFRTISSHGKSSGTRLSNAVVSVRLLASLFPSSHGPWQKEVDSFDKWISTHSISNGNTSNISTDAATQSKEPYNIAVKDRTIEVRSSSSQLGHDGAGFPNWAGAPLSSNEVARLSEDQICEEETGGTVGNNVGNPPRTPSRSESPVEACPGDRQLSTEIAPSVGHQMAGLMGLPKEPSNNPATHEAHKAGGVAEDKLQADTISEDTERMVKREERKVQGRKGVERKAKEEGRDLEAKRMAESQAKGEVKHKIREKSLAGVPYTKAKHSTGSSIRHTRNKVSNSSISLANSAWSKGPPQTQSPANASNTPNSQPRRQSTLGPNVTPAVKQVPRGIAASTGHRTTSSINFGSIEAIQTPEKKAETATPPATAPNPAQSPANGIKVVAPTPTQPVSASAAMTAPTTASTAPAAAVTLPGTTPTPSKQKKVNVHALLQGWGMPSVTTTPPVTTSTPTVTAPAQPQVVAPSAPPPRVPASGFNDRNNPVQFPRSLQISRPTLPGPSTSGGQRPAGSPRLSANVPLQYPRQHPMVHPQHHHTPHPGHPRQPLPPQWGPAGYYYPHDYNPYMYWGGHPQHQHPHMQQTHRPPMQSLRCPPTTQPPPSTHPLPNNTFLQAPPSAPSPSPTVIQQPFVPDNPHILYTSGDAISFDRLSYPPASPKVKSPILPKRLTCYVETEQQRNERLAKEREEKGRVIREEIEKKINDKGII